MNTYPHQLDQNQNISQNKELYALLTKKSTLQSQMTASSGHPFNPLQNQSAMHNPVNQGFAYPAQNQFVHPIRL